LKSANNGAQVSKTSLGDQEEDDGEEKNWTMLIKSQVEGQRSTSCPTTISKTKF